MTEKEIAMLKRVDDHFRPAGDFTGTGHGQSFVHFYRRHPELFERQFSTDYSRYRLSEQGRALLATLEGDAK